MKSFVTTILIIGAFVCLMLWLFAPHVYMKKTPIGAEYRLSSVDPIFCDCGNITGYKAIARAIKPAGTRADSITLEGNGGQKNFKFSEKDIGKHYTVLTAYADDKMFTSEDWTPVAKK